MFYWDESFLIGIKEIDDEHFELCKIANNLFEAFLNGTIANEINPTLEYFELYINNHFYYEENLHCKTEYPKFLEHKEKHNCFVKEILRLKTKIKAGITDEFIKEFNYTVVDWLTFHFREDDLEFANYYKATNAQVQNF